MIMNNNVEENMYIYHSSIHNYYKITYRITSIVAQYIGNIFE